MTKADSDDDRFGTAYAGEIEFPSLGDDVSVRTLLGEALFGPIPAAPDRIKVSRIPISGETAERLSIEIQVADRRLTVDAALWLPPEADDPAPLIYGLDFVGPLGLMTSREFPIDPNARISTRAEFGARDSKRMEETLRGVSAYRWPVDMLRHAGYAVLVSCYGSWVPDDADSWRTHGVYPLLKCQDDQPVGAISLWAWAIQRLLDAAATCDEIDMSSVAVAGHSRLGKAALWATANDQRIGTVFANQSGCGGSAPAAHCVGETFAQMEDRFPHWTIPASREKRAETPFDQHHLLSLIAPRRVYLAGAQDDVWSDPVGSFLMLKAASVFWEPEDDLNWIWPPPRDYWQDCRPVRNGPLGCHIRPGGHDVLPYDWRHFLDFMRNEPILKN